MNYLTADTITLNLGGTDLLENLSFSIEDKSKIALIGLNGCGKSSLMKIIAGKLEADSGTITKNSNCKIHYVEQMPNFNDDDTLLEYIFSSFTIPQTAIIKRYEELLLSIETEGWDDQKQEELDKVSNEMEHSGAWDFEGRLKALINQFNIPPLTNTMGSLSGGMIRKLSLVQAILAEPDLLILDEPTNHLDIATILWLQEYLSKWNKAFLLVTHDRYFLDNVCNTIWEIADKRIYLYNGNYSYYLEKKAEREEIEQRRVSKINRLLKSEIEWMNRTPCARGTKQKARIDRAKEMMKVGGVKELSNAEMSTSGRRLGKKVLNLKNVSFSYPNKKILESVSYNFKRGEKIGLVGENGVGKSTLINLIIGKLKEDSGVIDRGVNTDFGLFSQIPKDMPMDMPILSYLKTFAEVITNDKGEKLTAGQMLERFLFPSNTHFKKIGKLSGGERRRLQLLTVLIQNPNFLILDEPTNDLDIHTLTVLEDFLLTFDGVLLIVSHDRFFLDKVCDFLLVMEGDGEISGFPGHYSDYLLYKTTIDREIKKNEKSTVVKEHKSSSNSNRLTFKEKKELQDLEVSIEELENEISEIESKFSTVIGEELKELSQTYNSKKELLDRSISRWEELSEKELS